MLGRLLKHSVLFTGPEQIGARPSTKALGAFAGLEPLGARPYILQALRWTRATWCSATTTALGAFFFFFFPFFGPEQLGAWPSTRAHGALC